MQDASIVERIRRKFLRMEPALNERSGRFWAATESLELGWGGVTTVAMATGLSPITIRSGIRELRDPPKVLPLPADRMRRPGGGRKKVTDHDPNLRTAL